VSGVSVSLDEANGRLPEELAYVRGCGVLGRPGGRLSRLFDYLAGRAEQPVSPKESEIAHHVFVQHGDRVAADDAVVRVYMHRLRKKLDALYERDGQARPQYLRIPRGEYRLVLTARQEAGETQSGLKGRAAGIDRRWLAGGLAGLLIAINIGGWFFASRDGQGQAAFLKASPWSGMAGATDRPLLIVTGDYYIHGELDRGGNVRRLVREFSVNSRDELYQSVLVGGVGRAEVMDLGLSYLPTSTGAALARMAPLIAARKAVQIVTSSALTPEMIRENDILYLGLFSALGPLQEGAFRGSRIGIGESFDELTDRKTDVRYVSEGTRPSSSRQMILDYGYFSTMPGPGGGRITILAGTRDVGLAGVAEAMADAELLRSAPRLGPQDRLEMLFEAEGAGGLVLTPNLLMTEHHTGSRAWSTEHRDTDGRAGTASQRP
jgi:hypothetical protein